MIPKEETYTNNQSQDLDKDIFLHVMFPHDDCCGFIACITQNFNLRGAPKNRPQKLPERAERAENPGRAIPHIQSDFDDKQITMCKHIQSEQGISAVCRPCGTCHQLQFVTNRIGSIREAPFSVTVQRW